MSWVDPRETGFTELPSSTAALQKKFPKFMSDGTSRFRFIDCSSDPRFLYPYFSNLSMGIEIELLLPRQKTSDIDKITRALRQLGFWGTAFDRSIASTKQYAGVELVSNILKRQAVEAAVTEAIEDVFSLGATVDESCGLHIHLGRDNQGFSFEETRKIIVAYSFLEPCFFMLVPNYVKRLASKFSKPLDYFVAEDIMDCTSMDEIKTILLGSPRNMGGNKYGVKNKYCNPRYKAFNLYSLFYRKTLEFRHFPMVLTKDYIMKIASICCLFVSAATSIPESELLQIVKNKPQTKDTLKYFLALEGNRTAKTPLYAEWFGGICDLIDSFKTDDEEVVNQVKFARKENLRKVDKARKEAENIVFELLDRVNAFTELVKSLDYIPKSKVDILAKLTRKLADSISSTKKSIAYSIEGEYNKIDFGLARELDSTNAILKLVQKDFSINRIGGTIIAETVLPYDDINLPSVFTKEKQTVRPSKKKRSLLSGSYASMKNPKKRHESVMSFVSFSELEEAVELLRRLENRILYYSSSHVRDIVTNIGGMKRALNNKRFNQLELPKNVTVTVFISDILNTIIEQLKSATKTRRV